MAVLLHHTSGVDQRRVSVPGGTPRAAAQSARAGAAMPARSGAQHRYRAPGGGARVRLRGVARPHSRTRPSGHPVLSLIGIAALACLAVVGLGLVGALSAPPSAPSGPTVGVSASFRP